MLQVFSSYIWGEEENGGQITPDMMNDEGLIDERLIDGQIEVDNEWLMIPKNINDDENDTENDSDGEKMDSEGSEEETDVTKAEPKPVGNNKQLLSKRVALKDLNAKVSKIRKNDSAKNLKRVNQVQNRSLSTRKNKQFGRMEGKHSGMVGPRAK